MKSMKPKFTGTKHTALGVVNGKSKRSAVSSAQRYPYLAICVQNKGNEASLQLGKAYQVIKPRKNDIPFRIRVIDEEGDDYLYLADWFVPIEVSPGGRKRVLNAVKVA